MLRDSRGGVLFRGAGTKMSWAGRPHDPDLVLETTGLDRLLEHNPADMTASAQAGMPLRALQDRLRPRPGSGLRSTRPPNQTGRPWAGCSPPASPARAGCGTARCVTS